MELVTVIFFFHEQVVCVDYPRPQIDDTVNFIEAASLSASFRTSKRPSKPLKIVIAGAGQELACLA